MIGTFGNVVFETGTNDKGFFKSRTWKQLNRSVSARFARHNVLKGPAKLEFQGVDLQTIDIEIRLDTAFGLNPLAEIDVLKEILARGEEQRLVIGGKSPGKFVLKNLEDNWLVTDNKGNLLKADVTLKLLEYHGN